MKARSVFPSRILLGNLLLLIFEFGLLLTLGRFLNLHIFDVTEFTDGVVVVVIVPTVVVVVVVAIVVDVVADVVVVVVVDVVVVTVVVVVVNGVFVLAVVMVVKAGLGYSSPSFFL